VPAIPSGVLFRQFFTLTAKLERSLKPLPVEIIADRLTPHFANDARFFVRLLGGCVGIADGFRPGSSSSMQVLPLC
jgi:hypothetical protein